LLLLLLLLLLLATWIILLRILPTITTLINTILVDELCHNYIMSITYKCDIKKVKKGKGSPYSIAERRVPGLIPVLGSQPAGAVSHKPGSRIPLH